MFLDKILKIKQEEIEYAKRQRSLADLKSMAADMEPCRDFLEALKSERAVNIIAEIKKASPSAGVIREDFDPQKIAFAYEKGGACAISVVTDVNFFQGSIEHLESVRQVAEIPILRKDFVLGAYQIYEARSFGADAVLLIARILGKNQLEDLMELARELRLSTLVEIRSAAEWDKIKTINFRCVGINNRDIDSLEIDLTKSEEIAPKIPEGIVKVAESGIKGRDDIERLKKAGIDAFLIGEALLKTGDVGGKLREFFSDS